MSKSEILEELPELTSEERYEIRENLAELDGDDWFFISTLSSGVFDRLFWSAAF